MGEHSVQLVSDWLQGSGGGAVAGRRDGKISHRTGAARAAEETRRGASRLQPQVVHVSSAGFCACASYGYSRA